MIISKPHQRQRSRGVIPAGMIQVRGSALPMQEDKQS
jgi:hypothetical protein